MKMDEGYLTLACGSRRYLEIAINLALSIRRMDPSRRICVVHDEHVPLGEADRACFDHAVLMKSDPNYTGCANKLRLYDCSPFEKTFYIDSDCLIGKFDMDRHWRRFSGSSFNVAGGKASDGDWYNFNIAQACARLNIKYLVVMNTGVIYFRKPDGKAAFDAALRLYTDSRDVIGAVHQKRPGQLADEPFFGAAMGKLEIEPIQYSAEEGSIMISTLYTRRLRMNLDAGISSIEVPTGFYLMNRVLARSWIKHSPTITHFIGLKPRKAYHALAAKLRQEAPLLAPSR